MFQWNNNGNQFPAVNVGKDLLLSETHRFFPGEILVSSGNLPILPCGDPAISLIADLTGDAFGKVAEFLRFVELDQEYHLSVGTSGLARLPYLQIDARKFHFGTGKIRFFVDAPVFSGEFFTINVWNPMRNTGDPVTLPLAGSRFPGSVRRTEACRAFSCGRMLCTLVGCRRC